MPCVLRKRPVSSVLTEGMLRFMAAHSRYVVEVKSLAELIVLNRGRKRAKQAGTCSLQTSRYKYRETLYKTHLYVRYMFG